jgi:chromosome segregation ATPase
MATGLELARRGRVRHWLSSDAPASKGAQVFMFVAALLCGAALAGLLFVGVWRHTAGEAARSQAARVGDQQALRQSRRTIAALSARLANEQALLARSNHAGRAATAALAQARSALAQAHAELARARAADGAAIDAMKARISGLSADAARLQRATATLSSELTALETYAQNPGATGIDPGYLANQVRYLEASAAAASSAASELSRRAGG